MHFRSAPSVLALLRASILAAITAPCFAGPFGLAMGDSLEDIKAAVGGAAVKRIGPSVYVTSTAPKPLRIGGTDEAFDQYILLISEKHGLCKMMAIGRPFETTLDGADLLQRFNALEAALGTQYGSASRLDAIKLKSVWTGANDWMMALLKKDRELTSTWSAGTSANRNDQASSPIGPGGVAVGERAKSGNAMLPDSIVAIELGTKAIGTGVAALRLGFEFENTSECITAVRGVAPGPEQSQAR